MQSPLPLLIGGKGDRMMGVVARHADEWNMWGLADAIAERVGRARPAVRGDRPRPGRDQAVGPGARAAHRRPRPRPTPSSTAPAAGPPSPAPPTTSPEAVADWQAVGLDEVIVPDFTLGRGARKLERLDALIEQVAPQFR